MNKVIDTIPKNATEQIQVGLTEYEGHDLVDIRVYYTSDGTIWKHSKKGVAPKISILPELISALSKVKSEARKTGIMQGASGNLRTTNQEN